jgi:hypothetical protein
LRIGAPLVVATNVRSPVFVASTTLARSGSSIASRLLGAHEDNAVSDVLASKNGRVSSPQASVKQDHERQPLSCADWPPYFEPVNLSLSPCVEASRLWPLHDLDALGRVFGDASPSTAHENRVRIVFRKLFAWLGVFARRSRPATIASRVTADSGISLASLRTPSMMFSR